MHDCNTRALRLTVATVSSVLRGIVTEYTNNCQRANRMENMLCMQECVNPLRSCQARSTSTEAKGNELILHAESEGYELHTETHLSM